MLMRHGCVILEMTLNSLYAPLLRCYTYTVTLQPAAVMHSIVILHKHIRSIYILFSTFQHFVPTRRIFTRVDGSSMHEEVHLPICHNRKARPSGSIHPTTTDDPMLHTRTRAVHI